MRHDKKKNRTKIHSPAFAFIGVFFTLATFAFGEPAGRPRFACGEPSSAAFGTFATCAVSVFSVFTLDLAMFAQFFLYLRFWTQYNKHFPLAMNMMSYSLTVTVPNNRMSCRVSHVFTQWTPQQKCVVKILVGAMCIGKIERTNGRTVFVLSFQCDFYFVYLIRMNMFNKFKLNWKICKY